MTIFFPLFRPYVAPAAPRLLLLYRADLGRMRLIDLQLASLAPDAGMAAWITVKHREACRMRGKHRQVTLCQHRREEASTGLLGAFLWPGEVSERVCMCLTPMRGIPESFTAPLRN